MSLTQHTYRRQAGEARVERHLSDIFSQRLTRQRVELIYIDSFFRHSLLSFPRVT